MRNGHRMFIYIYIYIYIEHRNLETRKTRDDFLVKVRNFLLPLSLKILRHKERDIHSFYSGFFICPLPISGDTCPRPPRASESQPSSSEAGLNSTNWLQNSQNPPRASGAWRHSYSLPPFPISGYCDFSEWHVRSTPLCARVNTCVNIAPKKPMHWTERFSA